MFPDQQNQNGQQPMPPTPQPLPTQPTYSGNVGTSQQTYDSLPPPSTTGRPGGHNPYEFIVSPNTPNNAKGPGSNKKFFMLIGFIVGGMALLMGAAVVILNLTAPKGSTQGLQQIAQRQQEIIRLSKDTPASVGRADTKNFVTTVYFTMVSSQKTMLSTLGKQGVKMNTKDLALNKDPQTDTLLSNAAAAGTYDTTLAQTLTDQLKTYEGLLKSTYNDTTSKTTKAVLQSAYTDADALVKQGQALSQ